MMGMTLWFASMAFGAIHVTAWNDFFPSKAERWMWRSGSVYVVASGLIWLSINFLAQVFPSVDRYWNRVLAKQASWHSYVVLGSLRTICGLAYGIAWIFLAVESFVSPRRLPLTACQTPDWSAMIPHL